MAGGGVSLPMRHGDPAMADLPAQPIVHLTTCRDVQARQVVLVDQGAGRRQAHPYARAHSCLSHGFAQGLVGYEIVTYEPHCYDPTMLWPGGIRRELCRVCYGTHPEDLPDHEH